MPHSALSLARFFNRGFWSSGAQAPWSSDAALLAAGGKQALGVIADPGPHA
jgi:hypothetical protein